MSVKCGQKQKKKDGGREEREKTEQFQEKYHKY